ncbi:TPA: hypothetical protein ACH9LQ_004951, partial [Escherichia coli]
PKIKAIMVIPSFVSGYFFAIFSFIVMLINTEKNANIKNGKTSSREKDNIFLIISSRDSNIMKKSNERKKVK